MSSEVANIGVVGLGTMGAGIVEVFARHALSVVAVDVDEAAVARGRGHVENSTGRALKRGRLTAQAQNELISRITFTTDLQALADADLVVEAVPERIELKRSVFLQLDRICTSDAILATNTSSLSVTEIAAATHRPGSVVGLHFFNPAPVMKLVEIVRTVLTEPDVITRVDALARRLGKVPVAVSDRAGFVANALLFGYLNRAAAMFESKQASREDIDTAMTIGCGLPMGPLALLDLVGLDVAVEILATMYEQSRDRLHAPAPIFRQMVAAGLLGRKTGRGFYEYGAHRSAPGVPNDTTPGHPKRIEDPARVSTILVVGSGRRAAEMTDILTTAGFDVATTLDAAADAQLVVEAETDAAEKLALLSRLDALCPPHTVLATTTSNLPVIEQAMATSQPSRVVGIHLVDYAPAGRSPGEGKVVEVVSTVVTASEAEAIVCDVGRRANLRVVRSGDRAGFIVDALLFPYLNDAVKMLESGYATADSIDAAMTFGCGYPVGPCELLDTLGIDVALAIQERLFEDAREPGLAPASLLKHLVIAGRRGRRAGHGLRDYS